MDNELAPHEQNPQAARFGDRLAAFTLDGLLFWAGYWASLAAVSNVPPWLSSKARLWLLPWAAGFVLYHALLSSGGRQTLGKWVLGLKIVDQEGGPLGFDQAVTRSLGYLPSSIFNLGFLIAPFSRQGLALHDRLAGSRVVELQPLSQVGRIFATAAGAASFALLASVWVWQAVAAPSYYQMRTVAFARHSLRNLGELQETYRKQNGRYSADLMELAALTGDTNGYLSALSGTVQPAYGVKISLDAKGGYVLEARANDRQATPVVFEKPAESFGRG